MPSARETMVATQLEGRGINNENIIKSFLSTDRVEFVPGVFKRSAYADCEIVTDYGVIFRPFVIAKIAQFIVNLKVKNILIINDICGYTASVYSNIFKNCHLGTTDLVFMEQLRSKVSFKALQIYDIKEKFEAIFFDGGVYKTETIQEIATNMLVSHGYVVSVSREPSCDFKERQFNICDAVISASSISASANIKILNLPLLLKTEPIA